MALQDDLKSTDCDWSRNGPVAQLCASSTSLVISDIPPRYSYLQQVQDCGIGCHGHLVSCLLWCLSEDNSHLHEADAQHAQGISLARTVLPSLGSRRFGQEEPWARWPSLLQVGRCLVTAHDVWPLMPLMQDPTTAS